MIDPGFLRELWEDDELLKVFRWVYPEECDSLKPKTYEDLPQHFKNLLKVNTKTRWLELVSKEHGTGNLNLKGHRG